MKNLKKTTVNYLRITVLLWGIIFLVRAYMPQHEELFFIFAATCGFILHVTTTVIILKIYKNISDDSRFIIRWMIISILSLLIVDMAWYIINSSIKFSILKYAVFVNAVGFVVWSTSSSLFTIVILKKYVITLNKSLKTVFYFALIDTALIALFTYQLHFVHQSNLDTHFIFTIWHVNIFVHIIEFALRILMINLVLLCLIYSESDGLILFSLGTIALFSSYSLVTYAGILKKSPFNSYADMLWFLGLILHFFGVVIIWLEKEYNVKMWVIRDSAFRGIILFFSFLIYTVIFALLFLIFYLLSIINIQNFLAFPIFYVVCIPIVTYAFIYLSKYFERPFKQLLGNIESAMLNADNKMQSFNIDEFRVLQDFITNAFAYKNQMNELQRKLELEIVGREQERFRKTIGQLIHDMNSPLGAINSFTSLSIDDISKADKSNVRTASKKLIVLVKNLLNKYKNKDYDATNQSFLLIIPSLQQILDEKQLEYQSENINFILDILEPDYAVSILINIDMFQRMISNLINNAVDAIKSREKRNVILKVRTTDENVTIFVEDNGIGMTERVQEKFLKGVTITEGKSSGHGFGLTQVYDTVQSGHGKLSIYASPNLGTEIVIRFEKSRSPLWLVEKINLKEQDTILIVDDDKVIHDIWIKKFKDVITKSDSLKIMHFFNDKDLIMFVDRQNSVQKDQLFLLVDYDLNADNNGIELIKLLGLKRAVLVTDYAYDVDIQNVVITTNCLMLPKDFISHIQINITKNIDKFSKVVDMVWLDDQEFFVKSIIRESYQDLKIDIYNNPLTFMAEIIYYKNNTRIILDMYYEVRSGKIHEKTGLEIAKELWAMGFNNVIILTGENLNFVVPEYLKVVMKTDRKALKNLYNM